MILVTVHVIMNMVGIPEKKKQRGLEDGHKNISSQTKKTSAF